MRKSLSGGHTITANNRAQILQLLLYNTTRSLRCDMVIRSTRGGLKIAIATRPAITRLAEARRSGRHHPGATFRRSTAGSQSAVLLQRRNLRTQRFHFLHEHKTVSKHRFNHGVGAVRQPHSGDERACISVGKVQGEGQYAGDSSAGSLQFRPECQFLPASRSAQTCFFQLEAARLLRWMHRCPLSLTRPRWRRRHKIGCRSSIRSGSDRVAARRADAQRP